MNGEAEMKKADCKKCSNLNGAKSEIVDIGGELKTQWYVDCEVFGVVRVIGGGDKILKSCMKYEPSEKPVKKKKKCTAKEQLMREIGARIRKIRKEFGLNQTHFGAKSNTSRGIIGFIESGKVSPRLELLISLYRDYNVNINYVLTGEGKMFRKALSDFQFIRR